MESKIYTAQELREAADFFVRNAEMVRQKVLSNAILANIHDLIPMLRYAAETQERCEKVIARCNEAKDMNSPTWTFDSQAFAMDLHEIVNYILRGDAGKEKKMTNKIYTAQKMREALMRCADIINKFGLAEILETPMEVICDIKGIITAAISAPPRNCDRPECATTDAAQEVWRKEDGGKTAYYEWLLATSTKGETDEQK